MDIIAPLLSHPSLLAYFTGANNYTWLHFRNGKSKLLAKPLVYFEDRLPQFIRVHKTALVNPEYIAGIQRPPRPKMAGLMYLQDGTQLPISRRRWSTVSRLVAADSPGSPAGSDAYQSGQAETLTDQDRGVRIQTVLDHDATVLTKLCLSELNCLCTVQPIKPGIHFVNELSLAAPADWPRLILLDAQLHPTDCLLTLQGLKNHPQLRAIPVVWLMPPGDDPERAYLLGANSVIIVQDNPTTLLDMLRPVLYYWLQLVQFPA